jgi:superfamily II DNA or RNA helicase
MTLCISPNGHLLVDAASIHDDAPLSESLSKGLARAFAQGSARGLFYLATEESQASLPPPVAFAREFGRTYLTRLCHTPEIESQKEFAPIPPPEDAELTAIATSGPPMRGMEYLNADVLSAWWGELDALVRQEVRASGQTVQEYLRGRNPLWWMVGRVSFHLAENKRDTEHPFAFLATYANRVSAQGRLQHLPLGQALQEYSGAKNRAALLSLLQPIYRAAERSEWVKELVNSGDVYQPLAWTPSDAHQFLQAVPLLEESGLVVRVPDWWKSNRPPRPVVSVKIDGGAKSKLSAEALLNFSVHVTVDGERLSKEELDALLGASGGLISLKGKWVQLDRDRLAEALKHWQTVEDQAGNGGLTFFEGMRLLSGANLDGDAAADVPETVREWTGISVGPHLEQKLHEMRHPQVLPDASALGLRAELRPYQSAGVHWLRFMTQLGLGACLADDMGLGKTIQVITLLLHLTSDHNPPKSPSLLIVPASLIANWKSELARFAPSLSVGIMHPSEMKNGMDMDKAEADGMANLDLVITTYSMLGRIEHLRQREWKLIILDEAQAIKNSGSLQTRRIKELRSAARIALTGTPVENRLSDLWSLFDFLNPGLLGGAKVFAKFAKQLAGGKEYGPLRTLVRPYILRRLKTDKEIIADLPEKTEVNAFCGLSKRQAVLYEQSVRELEGAIRVAEGIQRRGIVLSYLMKLKQICNHPSQLTGDGAYEPQDSGKFRRLAEICQELAERQEKALIFSQFREIIDPLAEFLSTVFGRRGLVLHGQTAVGKRRELIDSFQKDDGPPFFILSLKAGGVGLNLTNASHVIHFDRWWNPAVENQATDRAFRIGQKKNVLVHKFVCRGTVEDKINELIAQKSDLARNLLDDGAGTLLTEMDNDQLLRFVALDISQAMES